ncbi:MAG TPA: hypothetical protein VEA16_23215 [Vicinamibacterales bacterium]|nr:hypothetical protein [Vicinamibacterales bacterium]
MNTLRCSVLAWMVSAVSVATAQSLPRAPLFLAVSIDAYIAETYAERPKEGADYFFLTGEPIGFKVIASNQDTPPLVLNLRRGLHNAVHVLTALKDGQPVPITITVNSVSRVLDIGAVDLTDDVDHVTLEKDDRLEWRFALNESLEPGLYRLSVTLLADESHGRPILWRAHEIRFEVRPASSYPAEAAIREAYRNTGRNDDLARAEDAVRQLLEINPDSWVAHSLLALIADSRGDSAASARHRAKAAEISKAGTDKLYLKYCDAICFAMRRHGGE